MTLQIEQDCESFTGCLKGILVSIYAVIVIVIISRIIYKLRIYMEKKISFEIIPLSSAILQSILQLVINLLYFNTKLMIASLSCQTFTFGVISTSCSQLCLRIKYPDNQPQVKLYSIIAFILAQIVQLTGLFLTLFDVIPIDCKNWFSLAYLFPMVVMILYTILSVSFGSQLIRALKANEQSLDLRINDSVNISKASFSIDDMNFRRPKQKQSIQTTQLQSGYIMQLKRQLGLIEVLFISTIFIQMAMDAIRSYAMTNSIVCIDSDNSQYSYEFQANSTKGHIFLIFYQIIQISPCLIAPYIFFYVPFHRILLTEESQINFNLLNDEIEDEVEESNTSEENQISRSSLKEELIRSDDKSNPESEQIYQSNTPQLKSNISNSSDRKQSNYRAPVSRNASQIRINNNNNNNINFSNSNLDSSEYSDTSDEFFKQSRTKRQQTITKMENFMDRMSIKRDDIVRLDRLEQESQGNNTSDKSQNNQANNFDQLE